MNARQIDQHAAIEEARAKINDGQGEVSTSSFTSANGTRKVTVTFSISVDAQDLFAGKVNLTKQK